MSFHFRLYLTIYYSASRWVLCLRTVRLLSFSSLSLARARVWAWAFSSVSRVFFPSKVLEKVREEPVGLLLPFFLHLPAFFSSHVLSPKISLCWSFAPLSPDLFSSPALYLSQISNSEICVDSITAGLAQCLLFFRTVLGLGCLFSRSPPPKDSRSISRPFPFPFSYPSALSGLWFGSLKPGVIKLRFIHHLPGLSV